MRLTDSQRHFLRVADGERGGVIAVWGPHRLMQDKLRRLGLIEKHADGYYHTTEAGRTLLSEAPS